MSLQVKSRLHFAEWLERERSDSKGHSEYLDGEVFAMTGAEIDDKVDLSLAQRPSSP